MIPPDIVAGDTIIHWLIGGLAVVASAFTGILGFMGKGALDRLKAVEDSKVEKVDFNRSVERLEGAVGKVGNDTTQILLMLAQNRQRNDTR
jgi:hypothetical protein